jgi:hypothetical protein
VAALDCCVRPWMGSNVHLSKTERPDTWYGLSEHPRPRLTLSTRPRRAIVHAPPIQDLKDQIFRTQKCILVLRLLKE